MEPITAPPGILVVPDTFEPAEPSLGSAQGETDRGFRGLT
jgi:hypothetical protein